jgi:hypothetical protein
MTNTNNVNFNLKVQQLFSTLEVSPVVTEEEIAIIKEMFVTSTPITEVRKNRNEIVKLTSEAKDQARELNDMNLWDKWNNLMSKTTAVLDMTLNRFPTQLEKCEVTNVKGDKVFYKGTMLVNGETVEITFSQVANERFSVRSYTVGGEKQQGSNVIAFLTEQGLVANRKQLFDGFVILAN